jgi:hypothetical protein
MVGWSGCFLSSAGQSARDKSRPRYGVFRRGRWSPALGPWDRSIATEGMLGSPRRLQGRPAHRIILGTVLETGPHSGKGSVAPLRQSVRSSTDLARRRLARPDQGRVDLIYCQSGCCSLIDC